MCGEVLDADYKCSLHELHLRMLDHASTNLTRYANALRDRNFAAAVDIALGWYPSDDPDLKAELMRHHFGAPQVLPARNDTPRAN
jgi:hypothetical protein